MIKKINFTKKYPTLDKVKERELLLDYQNTKNVDSLNKLILHNVSFVLWQINKYHRTVSTHLKEDIVQEGILGLIHAINVYNTSKSNVRLCSYARFWIRVYIQQYFQHLNKNVTTNSWHLQDNDGASEETPEKALMSHDAKKTLYGIFNQMPRNLSTQEQIVLNHRLLSESPLTLADIGKKINVTRERARQIEFKLISDMKKAII